MYYFKRNSDSNSVTKYEVSYNEDDVKKLQKEIIDNCSEIEHIETQLSEYQISYIINSSRNIINFKKGDFIGQRDYFESADVENYYDCSYDRLTFSPLVSLIDRLLEEDESVINEIMNPIFIERLNYNELIEEKDYEIDAIDNLDVDIKIQKLNELKDILENAKLNQEMKSDNEYYDKLKKLIIFEPVETISQDNIDNAIETLSKFEKVEELEKFEIRKLCKEKNI